MVRKIKLEEKSQGDARCLLVWTSTNLIPWTNISHIAPHWRLLTQCEEPPLLPLDYIILATLCHPSKYPCFVYEQRLERLSRMLNNHKRVADGPVWEGPGRKRRAAETQRKRRDGGSKRGGQLAVVKIKWWENARGQCRRSYCCDSPALSVICKLDSRFSRFTVGLMLGHCRFYTLAQLKSFQ